LKNRNDSGKSAIALVEPAENAVAEAVRRCRAAA
jgi:hypothetical protein